MGLRRRWITIAVALLLCASRAVAEQCNVPPSAALPLSATKDAKYRNQWCNDGDVATLWSGLSLDHDLWDEGWGFDDVCNLNTMLSRLFSAGFIVRQVQSLAPHFAKVRAPYGSPYNIGHLWWDFVKANEDDGYEPRCCNAKNGSCGMGGGCLWATHYCCATSTDLCVAWGFIRGAADRSSTLVHEATHEDVGHIGDDECANGGSCDTYYGAYNANTMQINYLYDSVSVYRMSGGKPQVSQFSQNGTNMCKFIPFLEDDERATNLADIKDRLDSNFQSGSVFPEYFDVASVDAAYGSPWECKKCNPQDYTFSSATFGTNKACNEITNHDNAGVNAANRATCQAFNGKISSAPSADEYAQIYYSELYGKLKSCLYADPDDVDGYCEERKDAANHVSQIDPKGFLASAGYMYEEECVAEFCEEKFQDSWTSHAADPNWDDPLGCLDLLCGNDADCRRRYLTYKGVPAMYDPDHCTEGLLECYESKGATLPVKGEVSAQNPSQEPDPELKPCHDAYDLCRVLEELKRKLAAYKLIEVWEAPGPGPVEKLKANPWQNPAPEAFKQALLALQAKIKSGMPEDRARHELDRLMSHPESMAALYHYDAQTFVDLFGKERFRGLVGPSIQRFQPQALNASKLGSRSKPVFQQLQKLQNDKQPVQSQ
jgi:hypothetical protein